MFSYCKVRGRYFLAVFIAATTYNIERFIRSLNIKKCMIKDNISQVLKAINRFAFVKSPYPVVLSIENHLSIEQQQVMVSMMVAVFKKKLILEDLYPHDQALPSPDSLKHKIIVKNKKIVPRMLSYISI